MNRKMRIYSTVYVVTFTNEIGKELILPEEVVRHNMAEIYGEENILYVTREGTKYYVMVKI